MTTRARSRWAGKRRRDRGFNSISTTSPSAAADPDKTGVWRVELGDRVKPKRYRMRIDQIGPEGRVVARIESPFFPAGPIGALPRDAVVFVQPGNSLWRIARRTYGGGVQYTLIFEA